MGGELGILGHPGHSDVFIENFEADTGIYVFYVSGATREAFTRFRREGESELDIYLVIIC
ncbi:MAG: hypothetical protein GQ535_17575 [Rhodobacteraceae bacterium]|nr:hypothetical protein [Paracoccaceae bacterium]